ncbi:MAG: hypothetical protein AB8H86_14100 [Polyangiales bacterium]
MSRLAAFGAFGASLLLASLSLGCIDTGAEPVSIPLSVAGTASEGIIARRGVPVTLERADLAFGPLTLCAGFQAGDNCDSALAEWRDSVVIDALDPAAMPVGALDGVGGSARSYMYDLGFVSLLTTSDPLSLPAAEALGGASYVLEGSAEVDGVTIPFSARAVLSQSATVERGIPIIRSGPGEAFARELDETSEPLTLRFDPAAWVSDIDFGALVQSRSCTTDVDVVCDGQLEHECALDGSVASTRECTANGEVCQPGVGCVERIELAPGSQALSAIRTALLSQTRPAFE